MKRIIILLSILCVVACAKFEEQQVTTASGQVLLNISSSISQAVTKATQDGFIDGDAVGLYAVNYSNQNTIAGSLEAIGNQADNVMYVYHDEAQTWKSMRPTYYKDLETNVDLYLYYPYISEIENPHEYPFRIVLDQSRKATNTSLSGYEQSDLLWGKSENVVPSEASVHISLTHRLSRIVLNLKEGSGFDEDEFAMLDKSAMIFAVNRFCLFDFSTGNVSTSRTELGDVVMCKNTENAFGAILIPQHLESGKPIFCLTIDGINYSCSLKNDVVLQDGKQHVFSIVINKKQHVGEYELELSDPDIEHWEEDAESHGGSARQYISVDVKEPGSLETTLKNRGLNIKRIRNLKVGGRLNADDFYFIRDSMDLVEYINMKDVVSIEESPSGDYVDKNYYADAIPPDAFQYKNTLRQFIFPDCTKRISGGAFYGCDITGRIIIPDSVKSIGHNAFYHSRITSVSLPASLERIDSWAFGRCYYLKSQIVFPESLSVIDEYAFFESPIKGQLVLPTNLEVIGENAFNGTGPFIGDLIIPEKVTKFDGRIGTFPGRLVMNNLTEIGDGAFSGPFSGELILPEGLETIPKNAFAYNRFHTIVFPSTLRRIEDDTFYYSSHLVTPLVFPEGLISIGKNAFNYSSLLTGIEFPSTLESIGNNAFSSLYILSKIVTNNPRPPYLGSGAFDYSNKNNITVVVPEQSVSLYRESEGWSFFNRLGYSDFTINKKLIRCLNSAEHKEILVRALHNEEWEVVDSPDWVSVSSMSGVGKEELLIDVDEMPEGYTTQIESDRYPYYATFHGRKGEVLFRLKGHTSTIPLLVEQYDCEYADRDVVNIQRASKGEGVDVILLGDGFDALDIAGGKYLSVVNEAVEAFFNAEPYSTYRDYFNVNAVVSKSDESGIGSTMGTLTRKDNLFQINGSLNDPFIFTKEDYGQKFEDGFEYSSPSSGKCISYALQVKPNLSNTLVIMLVNDDHYGGTTFAYDDGFSVSICPVSEEYFPYDFRGVVQHQAGGHGFGHLYDEYVYRLGYFSCSKEWKDKLMEYQAYGWYINISLSPDYKNVPWAHLMFKPGYSNEVDIYEGAMKDYSRGIFRSESESCMSTNVPYYNSISRQAIVEEIKRRAGEPFSLEEFYANDSFAYGN